MHFRPGRESPIIRSIVFVIIQHPVLRSLDIIIMTAFDRPEEEQPRSQTKRQGKNDQKGQGPHRQNAENLIRIADRSARRTALSLIIDDL